MFNWIDIDKERPPAEVEVLLLRKDMEKGNKFYVGYLENYTILINTIHLPKGGLLEYRMQISEFSKWAMIEDPEVRA